MASLEELLVVTSEQTPCCTFKLIVNKVTLGPPLHHCLVAMTLLLVILAVYSEGSCFRVCLSEVSSMLKCRRSRGHHAIGAEMRDQLRG